MIDEAKAFERHKKAKAAAAASHTTFDMDDEGDMFEYDESNHKLEEGMAASRRCTIAFFFEHTYGAPPLQLHRQDRRGAQGLGESEDGRAQTQDKNTAAWEAPSQTQDLGVAEAEQGAAKK